MDDQADTNVASRFLSAFGETHTFQTFDDSVKKRGHLARQFHGTFEQHVSRLRNLNDQGAGVFFTVNETDGTGRKKKNITRVRALFVDLDNPDKPLPEFALAPSLVVESSPGKHHVYWLVNKYPREDFTAAQERLIHAYGGDPVIKDLPRVMRLPGFVHQKGQPFTTRVIHESGVIYD